LLSHFAEPRSKSTLCGSASRSLLQAKHIGRQDRGTSRRFQFPAKCPNNREECRPEPSSRWCQQQANGTPANIWCAALKGPQEIKPMAPWWQMCCTERCCGVTVCVVTGGSLTIELTVAVTGWGWCPASSLRHGDKAAEVHVGTRSLLLFGGTHVA
jgi:hypothetical protein